MFIKSDFVITIHERKSKLGKIHQYERKKTLITFMCDNCNELFQRERGCMSPNRISNEYYHVCNNCNAKKFAQEKSVEQRNLWNLPVSSMKTIDEL
jgi:uncharacterized protein YlaI